VLKTSEFIGILNTVLFSPDDLGIFLDAPAARRKLLDQEITKVSSGYLFALRKYRSLLKDRNSLLKQQKPDTAYLSVLEERMREESALIIRERREFIASINSRIRDLYRNLSGEDSVLALQYQCCIRDMPEEEGLRTLYENTRAKDLELHMTTGGVHREDIVFTLNGENVIYTASQGQKRMIMLAMKLAFIPYIEEKRGSRAVLLLDDVLSELDEERQRRLIGLIRHTGQCVITGTEMPAFLRSENPKIFTVSRGHMIGGNG
jgi:DNA replication and repair protein RecF